MYNDYAHTPTPGMWAKKKRERAGGVCIALRYTRFMSKQMLLVNYDAECFRNRKKSVKYNQSMCFHNLSSKSGYSIVNILMGEMGGFKRGPYKDRASRFGSKDALVRTSLHSMIAGPFWSSTKTRRQTNAE